MASSVGFYAGHASAFSVLIPLVIVFITKLNKGIPSVLVMILLTSLCADAINYIGIGFGYKSFLIANVYSIVEYFLVALLYYKPFSVSSTLGKFIIVASVIFTIAAASSIIVRPIGQTYFTDIWALACLFIIIYSSVYLNDLFAKKPVDNIAVYGQFWVNSAVFYYFFLNIFFFYLADKLFDERIETSRLLGTFHAINNIIKNLLFAVGVYYMSKPAKKRVVYHGMLKVEDPKAEEVQYAYERLRNMSVTDSEIVRELLDRWHSNDGLNDQNKPTK